MCEQTPMAYKKGDVVWVKLGPCWWPGEVVSLEELPGGIIESFKKPPLAVVKFFNEENYEFVKNLNNIYLYNCHKKYEFIKKGLDLHRAKHTFMGKFPSDVCAAEEKTDGNPNILNDPQLTPEKRTDYTDIFGLSTPKRGAKDSPRFKTKHSFSKHHSSGGSPKKRSSLVTHPRFLSKGKDDHQVRILIQVSEEAKAPSQEYKCHTCGFKSTRVDVIVLHNKSHITGVYTPVSISKKTKQSSPKRAKKPKKPVSPSKKCAEEHRSVLTDFKSDLLAEWNDDDDEEQSTSESINETFSKKHHLEDESDDAKRKKAMKMSHSTTRTLEEDLALAEKGIPLCAESSSDDESEDSLPKTNRKSPQSIQDETSCESGNKKELSKTLQSFLDFEKEVAKDNLVVYESEKRKESPVSDESDYVPLKNKRKHAKAPVTKAKKSKVNVTSKAKSDFTTDLLAEWDDDDDEDEGLVTENDDKSEQIGALNKEKKTSKDEVVKESDCQQSIATGKKEKSSCFDFDEDEDTELLARSEEGRKIPRVIPPTSNNKIPADNESSENQLDSVDDGKMVEKTEGTEVTVDNDKISEVTERLAATPDADVCNKDEETEAFNNILAATAVPKLPEIPQLLKCEQNFPSAGTIKFPDKNANEDFDCDAEKPDTPTAESNDKPEVIAGAEEKSTDDDAKANEETVPDVVITEAQEVNVTAETIEEDKTSVINEEEIADVSISKDPECSKVEKNVDIISEDDTPPSESPITTPVKSDSPKSDVTFDFQKTTSTDGAKQTEVATKLTNPKKRFVKTFEDETKNLITTEKTQEERIPDEVKNVKVSKLKTLLMSKININAYKKKGSARFVDYERVTTHRSKGAKGKLDVGSREISLPQKVESRPVLEPVLPAESLDRTITEDVDVKTSVSDSPPREKAIDDTNSSLLPKEDLVEDNNGENNEIADLQRKNETGDSSKEEKIEENITESNNLTDLHESKSDDALVESAPTSSDSEIVDRQQIQENTVADESKILEETESLPADNFDVIPEDEVQTSLDGDVKFDLGSSDEGTLNNLINEDMAEMEELRSVVEGGSLTIVDEIDLADKQVEITTQLEQKPITLSNFSMDFCEDSADVSDNRSVTIADKVEPEDKAKSKVQVDLGPVQDVEENISSFEINKQCKTLEEDVARGKEIVKTLDDENESVGVDVEKKVEEEKHDVPVVEKEMNLENEMAKITDAAGNDGNVSVEHAEESTSSTKLLEILTDVTLKQDKPLVKPHASVLINKSIAKDKTVTTKILNRIDSKAATTKIIGKPPVAGTSKVATSKLITEKVIKSVAAESAETLVSVKKVSSKRSYQDVEDIDAFIIQKPVKKKAVAPDASVHESVQIAPAQKGKARILQQTIITPAGDIIQPIVSSQSQGGDDNMFDINSMPIVLDDQILTPESIENMPIVLQESPPPPPPAATPVKSNPVKKMSSQQMKLLNKTVSPAPMKETTTVTKTQPSLIKQYASGKPTKVHKVYQTSGSKLLKNNPAVITQPGKPGKFIIVPSTSAPTGNKYTVGKRPPIIKRSTPSVNVSASSVTKVQNIAPEPTGNKIMIVTNNLGQQQRVLLTPVQQKMLAYPSPNQAKIKPALKNSSVQQKTIAVKESTSAAKVPVPKTPVASPGQVFSPITAQQLKNVKVDPGKTKKLPGQSQKFYLPVNKPSTSGRTIIIKNPQGQTVKRIQSTDDSLMEQQVAEQIQAINRASGKPLLRESSVKTRIPVKKSYAKKPIGDSPKILPQSKAHTPSSSSSTVGMNKASSLPPLAPISTQKKLDEAHSQTQSITEIGETQQTTEDKSEEPKRLPHQLVIQDAHGNQTTITEGQILALPSEAIDGQPQSYVLVTLDETGNLAPLNNEALMSLDPNLSLGGDLGNMVLQIDQGATSESEQAQNEIISGGNQEIAATNPVNVLPKPVEHDEQLTESSAPQNNSMDTNSSLQAVAINSGESGGQQLIITGDPLSTQKFLETLTEGNADLANLLANTKGNILIQAEGQQILINTDTENQMLLTVNPENLGNVENTEGNGNPIFANQPIKNQDILAAALADTDVFQQDQPPSKGIQSQLSPNSALYPIHAGNVLETNSMNSPIMTPLEVPSTNSKKIDDDVDILSQVPKNVDLPITITDPNISQTVAQQQVVSLMASDTLDLPLAIRDPSMSVTSSEMNSPSFVYSLPALDDAVDINQKAFSSSISMPLLTEDPDDTMVEATPVDADDTKSISEEVELSLKQTGVAESKSPTENPEIELSTIRDDKKDTFMDAEGLCTMRGGMCNSLSEPPPDMFDFSVGNQSYESSGDAKATAESPTNTNTTSTTNDTKPDLNEEDSSSGDKSTKLDVDSDLIKLDVDAKPPLDVLYSSVGPNNMEMRSHTPSTNTDDSCEIPVQPEIVTDLTLKNFHHHHNDGAMTDSNFESNGSSLNDESDI